MIPSRIVYTCAALVMTLPALAGETKVTHVNPNEAAVLLAQTKVTVIDVRSPEEFSEGHIKDAKNIDILDAKFEAGLAALDKKQPYLVHCASGGRSTRSLAVFQKLGFVNITHLDGGFNAWKAAGLPEQK